MMLDNNSVSSYLIISFAVLFVLMLLFGLMNISGNYKKSPFKNLDPHHSHSNYEFVLAVTLTFLIVLSIIFCISRLFENDLTIKGYNRSLRQYEEQAKSEELKAEKIQTKNLNQGELPANIVDKDGKLTAFSGLEGLAKGMDATTFGLTLAGLKQVLTQTRPEKPPSSEKAVGYTMYDIDFLLRNIDSKADPKLSYNQDGDLIATFEVLFEAEGNIKDGNLLTSDPDTAYEKKDQGDFHSFEGTAVYDFTKNTWTFIAYLKDGDNIAQIIIPTQDIMYTPGSNYDKLTETLQYLAALLCSKGEDLNELVKQANNVLEHVGLKTEITVDGSYKKEASGQSSAKTISTEADYSYDYDPTDPTQKLQQDRDYNAHYQSGSSETKVNKYFVGQWALDHEKEVPNKPNKAQSLAAADTDKDQKDQPKPTHTEHELQNARIYLEADQNGKFNSEIKANGDQVFTGTLKIVLPGPSKESVEVQGSVTISPDGKVKITFVNQEDAQKAITDKDSSFSFRKHGNETTVGTIDTTNQRITTLTKSVPLNRETIKKINFEFWYGPESTKENISMELGYDQKEDKFTLNDYKTGEGVKDQLFKIRDPEQNSHVFWVESDDKGKTYSNKGEYMPILTDSIRSEQPYQAVRSSRDSKEDEADSEKEASPENLDTGVGFVPIGDHKYETEAYVPIVDPKDGNLQMYFVKITIDLNKGCIDVQYLSTQPGKEGSVIKDQKLFFDKKTLQMLLNMEKAFVVDKPPWTSLNQYEGRNPQLEQKIALKDLNAWADNYERELLGSPEPPLAYEKLVSIGYEKIDGVLFKEITYLQGELAATATYHINYFYLVNLIILITLGGVSAYWFQKRNSCCN